MIAIFPEIIKCASENTPEELAMLVRKYLLPDHHLLQGSIIENIFENIGIFIQKMNLSYPGALLIKDENGKFYGLCN